MKNRTVGTMVTSGKLEITCTESALPKVLPFPKWGGGYHTTVKKQGSAYFSWFAGAANTEETYNRGSVLLTLGWSL